LDEDGLGGLRAGRRFTDAFGAVVRLQSELGFQTKLKAGGSGYLSQSDPRLLFGMGDETVARDVEVIWPDGQTQKLGDVAANQTIRVRQGQPGFETIDVDRFSLVDPPSAEERQLANLGFRIGDTFPDLALTDLQGEPQQLAQTAQPGRKRLVNLWATWCVPCSEEIPELQRLADRLADAGVDLLGVSVDAPETVDQVPEYLRLRGVTYPVRTTNLEGLERLFPQGEVTVPMTVLLDEKLRVLRVFQGWSHRTEVEVLALAGK
jgi:thiol-disulfide isomerase/thioredoxin